MLTLIASITNTDKVIGYRFLSSTPINNNNVMNLSIDETRNVIITNRAKGIKLDSDGQFTGTNGSLSRYSKVDSESGIIDRVCLVITHEITSEGKVIGYKLSDPNGIVKTFRVPDVIKLCQFNGLANGKTREVNGKLIISSITGSYEKIDIDSENNKETKTEYNMVEKVKRLDMECKYNPEKSTYILTKLPYNSDIVVVPEGINVVSIANTNERFSLSELHLPSTLKILEHIPNCPNLRRTVLHKDSVVEKLVLTNTGEAYHKTELLLNGCKVKSLHNAEVGCNIDNTFDEKTGVLDLRKLDIEKIYSSYTDDIGNLSVTKIYMPESLKELSGSFKISLTLDKLDYVHIGRACQKIDSSFSPRISHKFKEVTIDFKDATSLELIYGSFNNIAFNKISLPVNLIKLAKSFVYNEGRSIEKLVLPDKLMKIESSFTKTGFGTVVTGTELESIYGSFGHIDKMILSSDCKQLPHIPDQLIGILVINDSLREVRYKHIPLAKYCKFGDSSQCIEIGSNVFKDSMLMNFDAPRMLQIINREAFYNASSLKTVILNEGLIEIGKDAFYKCINLQYIFLPKSLTNIATGAFKGCGTNYLVKTTFLVIENSLAQSYCKKYKLRYEVVGSSEEAKQAVQSGLYSVDEKMHNKLQLLLKPGDELLNAKFSADARQILKMRTALNSPEPSYPENTPLPGFINFNYKESDVVKELINTALESRSNETLRTETPDAVFIGIYNLLRRFTQLNTKLMTTEMLSNTRDLLEGRGLIGVEKMAFHNIIGIASNGEYAIYAIRLNRIDGILYIVTRGDNIVYVTISKMELLLHYIRRNTFDANLVAEHLKVGDSLTNERSDQDNFILGGVKIPAGMANNTLNKFLSQTLMVDINKRASGSFKNFKIFKVLAYCYQNNTVIEIEAFVENSNLRYLDGKDMTELSGFVVTGITDITSPNMDEGIKSKLISLSAYEQIDKQIDTYLMTNSEIEAMKKAEDAYKQEISYEWLLGNELKKSGLTSIELLTFPIFDLLAGTVYVNKVKIRYKTLIDIANSSNEYFLLDGTVLNSITDFKKVNTDTGLMGNRSGEIIYRQGNYKENSMVECYSVEVSIKYALTILTSCVNPEAKPCSRIDAELSKISEGDFKVIHKSIQGVSGPDNGQGSYFYRFETVINKSTGIAFFAIKYNHDNNIRLLFSLKNLKQSLQALKFMYEPAITSDFERELSQMINMIEAGDDKYRECELLKIRKLILKGAPNGMSITGEHSDFFDLLNRQPE